mmetsp:Transcript_26988/g.90337  ORF Transcript_26988/g.90337 Transcript_26988/m.90337 type:complete len:229 (+) Transcript_26988:278-964(+)
MQATSGRCSVLVAPAEQSLPVLGLVRLALQVVVLTGHLGGRHGGREGGIGAGPEGVGKEHEVRVAQGQEGQLEHEPRPTLPVHGAVHEAADPQEHEHHRHAHKRLFAVRVDVLDVLPAQVAREPGHEDREPEADAPQGDDERPGEGRRRRVSARERGHLEAVRDAAVHAKQGAGRGGVEPHEGTLEAVEPAEGLGPRALHAVRHDEPEEEERGAEQNLEQGGCHLKRH